MDSRHPALSRRSTLQLGGAALLSAALPGTAEAGSPAREEESFDAGWRFHRGNIPDAWRPEFDDGQWRAVDLPHDWSIEDLADRPPAAAGCSPSLRDVCEAPLAIGPFDRERSAGKPKTGYTLGGTGWYRKRFSAAQLAAGQQVEIRFDGVYMNADVWLNGAHLGTQHYGYTSFARDLTPHLRPGDNVIAVRVRNEGDNSRWYSGSGIYRHVWLTTTGAVRVPLWGVSLTTAGLSSAAASLQAAVDVENREAAARDVRVLVSILDPDGRRVATGERDLRLSPGARGTVALALTLASPKPWSPDSPTLYSAVTQLQVAGRIVDEVATPFGVRTLTIDAQHGLRLNGRSMKLHGACIHSDNGLLGAAAIDRAEERKVELLKASGFNALRCSHNPFSPAFLDACDRLGMLVIEEAFDQWTVGKSSDDYHHRFVTDWAADLGAMIRRDRNHPSIIMWSIGNEIPEKTTPGGVSWAAKLRDEVRRLDPTRPVTAAVDGGLKIRPFAREKWMPFQPAFASLDVGGYNYKWEQFEPDHGDYPDRVMYGSESLPTDAATIWRLVERNSYILGDFVWTGMDYLGESGIGIVYLGDNPVPPPGDYPWHGSNCGDIDLIGQKRAQSFYRDVLWRRSPIELLVRRPVPAGQQEQVRGWAWSDEHKSWTWPSAEGKPVTVRAYSRADEVSLHLNGREVGRVRPDEKHTAAFEIPYEPGRLTAVAWVGGREAGSATLETAGAPAQLRLSVDRALLRNSRNELAHATVEVLDAQGRLVPDAAVPVRFSVEGAAELAASGNADPRDVVSFHSPTPWTFRGRALAILRPTGRPGAARLIAQAPGLAGAAAAIGIHD